MGLFVVAAGVRWAIGRWDKARKAWRADWFRVKEAAERDVKVTFLPLRLESLLMSYCLRSCMQAALDQALEKQVLIVPVRAAEGIEGIVAIREDEIRQLRREVDKLGAVISDAQNLAHRNPEHS
jgi:hypothetical protein